MLLSFFFISHVTLQLSTLSPFSWEVACHVPKHYSHWPFSNHQFHISRFPSHRLRIVESPLLPEPSRNVFLGILRKTLGVDPGMTPVQFQACEELHSLELSLILQCQEFSWFLRQAIRNCWRRRRYRTVRKSYATQRETGDKRGAAALNMQ